MEKYEQVNIPIKQTSSAYYARKRGELQEPEKYCEYCGARLHRRYNPNNGRFEDWSAFLKRKFCDASCAQKAVAYGRKKEREAEIAKTFKECKEHKGLFVDRRGNFLYKGKNKSVIFPKDRKGNKLTARLHIVQEGRKLYFQASRLVASTWKNGYTESSYVDYKDGDIHNISVDNLSLVSEKDYNKWKSETANGGKCTATYEYQVHRLENVITEAEAVLHYFKTEDMSKVNEHVKTYLYDVLLDYSLKTLHLGTHVAREQTANAIATAYDVIMTGHAVSHLEHYCKELLFQYRRNGSFGYKATIPKAIKLKVHHELQLDCLWEKYKVTKLR